MKLSDIAQESGVSISTVSRVINGTAKVSPEKERRVKEVLEKRGYVTNVVARSLASNDTKIIGILTPDIRHVNLAPIAYEAQRTMSEYGYDTILCNTTEKTSEQIKYIKILASRKVEGAILIGVTYSKPEILNAIDKYLSDIPVAMLNGNIHAPNIFHVFGGVDTALIRLMTYLLDMGHRKIVLVKEQSWNQDLKCELYKKLMKENGIEVTPEYIYEIQSKLDTSSAIVAHFERYVGDYTAVIANNDQMACAIIRELEEIGKKVPDIVSVTGYYDTEFGKLMRPALTTMNNKMTEMGEKLAIVLLKAIHGNPVRDVVRIEPELVIRGSVARCKE